MHALDHVMVLADHHVAVTSPLPVFEQLVPMHAPLQLRAMAVLTPQARNDYLYVPNLVAERAASERLKAFALAYKNDVELEWQFAAASALHQSKPSNERRDVPGASGSHWLDRPGQGR